jgi:hypothetical protein
LTFTSPRAWAYALLGIHDYLCNTGPHAQVETVRLELTHKLMDLFQRCSRADWPWFESSLSYANARLSQALLVSGDAMQEPDMRDAGLRSLDWLVQVQRSRDGYFAPVGTEGVYRRGERMPTHDQQPIEAGATVSACLDADRITDDPRWMRAATRAFSWYLGFNDLGQPLYDSATAGCRDGLHRDRVNENQGAESTLSFLLALTEMRCALRAGRGADEIASAGGTVT